MLMLSAQKANYTLLGLFLMCIRSRTICITSSVDVCRQQTNFIFEQLCILLVKDEESKRSTCSLWVSLFAMRNDIYLWLKPTRSQKTTKCNYYIYGVFQECERSFRCDMPVSNFSDVNSLGRN
ncbi:unnamed protein product [Amoebophrya sp. A25]|nr:unnamed protein product [Amoebophrya sp. A25]|eukprot:GSA25T00018807001.1